MPGGDFFGCSGGSSLEGAVFGLGGLKLEGALKLDPACFSGGGVDLIGGSRAFPESGSFPELLESFSESLELLKEEVEGLLGGGVVKPNLLGSEVVDGLGGSCGIPAPSLVAGVFFASRLLNGGIDGEGLFLGRVLVPPNWPLVGAGAKDPLLALPLLG